MLLGFLLAGLVALPRPVSAQVLDRIVTVRYQNETLGEALSDLEQRYTLYFTYSSYNLPVGQPVSASLREVPLRTALDTLLIETDIVYLEVDGQVVLRPDPNKDLLSQVDPLLTSTEGPLRPMIDPDQRREREKWDEGLATLGSVILELPGGDYSTAVDLDKYREAMRRAQEAMEEETPPPAPAFSDHQIAQVSLLPFLGTNAYRSNEVTNNFSLNVFWGTNGGVDGVELGGLVNTVVKDVKGVQVAGLGNTVGGKVTGTQLAGLFNLAQDTVVGGQAAGLFNITKSAESAQMAGVFNVNRQDFAGLQAAGLFNVSGGEARALQLAGLFNWSGAATKTQLSGLFNRAGDVSGSQISGLLNVGGHVRGAQIGLINVSDSINGPPIGLINIVKKGYNRIEIGGSKALYANLGFKFGARSFYNIFHFGGRWDALERRINETTSQQGIFFSWGLGYGLGTVVGLSARTSLNMELVAIHINELEAWTRELNLLNQLRLSVDIRLGQSRSSFFLGPTANLMLSKRRDPDTGLIGSNIPPYVHFEDMLGDTSLKFWAGGYAGFRF